MTPADCRDDDWNDAKNERRLALIDLEVAGTITVDESLELEVLQEELQDHVERVAPLPIEYARRLHRELLAKAGSAGTAP